MRAFKLIPPALLIASGLILMLLPADPDRLAIEEGNELYARGMFEEAAERFEEAIDSEDPRLAEIAYYNLGNCYLKTGRYEEAYWCYVNALRIDPGDVDAKNNLELALKYLSAPPTPFGELEREGEEAVERRAGGSSEGVASGRPPWREIFADLAEDLGGPDW